MQQDTRQNRKNKESVRPLEPHVVDIISVSPLASALEGTVYPKLFLVLHRSTPGGPKSLTSIPYMTGFSAIITYL